MRIELLGSQLDCLTMEETVSRIKQLIATRIPTQHVVINAGKINQMKQDARLRHIVNQCPLINADGISILLAGKLLGYSVPERVTGIDLMERLVHEANKEGYRIYLLGATEAVVQKVAYTIRGKYPDVQIVGTQHGYFPRETSSQVAESIKASQADLLFVAFSSPEKEYWVHRHLAAMNVPFVMGVGGSFDVLAGKTTRAPRFIQRIGGEWCWRFIQEPRRMFKRYIIGNLLFLNHVFSEKWGKR